MTYIRRYVMYYTVGTGYRIWICARRSAWIQWTGSDASSHQECLPAGVGLLWQRKGAKRNIHALMQNLALLDIQEVGVASGLSIAVDREGRIAAIGPDHEVDSRMDGCSFERCIDASGMSVVPG